MFEFKKITCSHIPELQVPAGIKEIAIWLKFNALPSDKFILSADAWDLSDQDIIVRSGIYPRNVFLASTPLASPDTNLKERVNGFIATQKPRYLILNSTSFLQKILNFDMNQKNLSEFGCTLKVVYSQYTTPQIGRFNIYRIYYRDNQ